TVAAFSLADFFCQSGFTGGSPANFGGISMSAFVISTGTGFRSDAYARSPSRCASSGIDPPPQNGSSTGGARPGQKAVPTPRRPGRCASGGIPPASAERIEPRRGVLAQEGVHRLGRRLPHDDLPRRDPVDRGPRRSGFRENSAVGAGHFGRGSRFGGTIIGTF